MIALSAKSKLAKKKRHEQLIHKAAMNSLERRIAALEKQVDASQDDMSIEELDAFIFSY